MLVSVCNMKDTRYDDARVVEPLTGYQSIKVSKTSKNQGQKTGYEMQREWSIQE